MSDRENLPPSPANYPTRRQWVTGVTFALGSLGFASARTFAEAPEEISHSAESIHLETVFKASRKRVYEALTDAKQFHKVTQLSAAVQSGMAPGTAPTEIANAPGGAFSFFGGYISGRNIELVSTERIIQAWRAGGWPPGIYSIAKFDLVEQGSDTKLVFDHTGFPKGEAEHLVEGWKTNYWQPLSKFLALP
jgi:activator of HSP90 ATPase